MFEDAISALLGLQGSSGDLLCEQQKYSSAIPGHILAATMC